MKSDVLQFHNLHLPNEVRVFQIPRSDVRVWNDQVMVYDVCFLDPQGNKLTFRHYSFYDQWFEINITLDKYGKLITERGPIDWSLNCDICTPCFNKGSRLFNVDLELDVLVSGDEKQYIIIDEDDFDRVVRQQLISEEEQFGAKQGLNILIEWITSGQLIANLETICPFSDLIDLAAPLPMKRINLSNVPVLSLHERHKYYGNYGSPKNAET